MEGQLTKSKAVINVSINSVSLLVIYSSPTFHNKARERRRNRKSQRLGINFSALISYLSHLLHYTVLSVSIYSYESTSIPQMLHKIYITR